VKPARTLFKPEVFPSEAASELMELCRQARVNILKMTSLAGSGHPGGSMSSLEIYALLWSQTNVDPARPSFPGRDRIVVSHGHTSPGVYSVLGALGFFDLRSAIVSFRLAGSCFEGHIERHLPGIELTSGNLGQGLSSAVGLALADRAAGHTNHIWVVTGDGEHQKGQIAEARRFAAKYGLKNLTCIVDVNRLQISGSTADVMPVDIQGEFASSGWEVASADGHDFHSLYDALRPQGQRRPRLVLANTVMGKGVSFMENREDFHGRALTPPELTRALEELHAEDDMHILREERNAFTPEQSSCFVEEPAYHVLAQAGTPVEYSAEHRGDNRSAWGTALLSLAESNPGDVPLVFDCDLSGSVKTRDFENRYPDSFFQSGIMEHHTASMAGGASLGSKAVFWSDFGVFAADETFNQHRINDINRTNLKVVATHCGLDVGPDGKTHHCIKYIGLTKALPNCRTIVPADPNQTDRAVRYAATSPGNFFIAMGRSRVPVITGTDGLPFFGGGYEFEFGRTDVIREGSHLAILALGPMTGSALEAAELLGAGGIEARVVSVSCPNALPKEMAADLQPFRLVVTCEDHDIETGLGASVALMLSETGGAPPLLRLGVRGYGMSGEPEDLYAIQDLQPEQIAEAIESAMR
jgi:transketolase